MIALDIPCAFTHSFRIGERGWVKEHQIVATGFLFGSLLYPRKDICTNKLVLATRKARILHVALRPIKIGLAHIDRSGRGSATHRSIDRCRAGIGK